MTFATLALICLVALLGPLLSLQRRIPVPMVVAELAVGLALGATGLRLLDGTDPTFSFLGDIGFALVMFTAGSHVPVRDPALRTGLKVGVLYALAVGALSVPTGLAIDAWLAHTGHGALYAVILASSSASLIMPALAGIPLTAPAIVSMLPQIAIADAACIVLLPLVIDPVHVVRAAIGAAAVLAAGLVIFLFLRWAENSGRRRRFHDVSEERGLAMELRVSLVFLFSLAALAAFAHVSIMLAGFVLGLALAGIGEPRRLAKQLFALSEGLFSPIFFVWLGASLNLRDLAAHPSAIWLGLALGIGAVVVHGLMVIGRQPGSVAVATCAELGVPVAAATMGRQLSVLAPGEDTALILGAIVTIAALAAVTGPLARLARSTAPDSRASPVAAP